jgi:hypothetical protein
MSTANKTVAQETFLAPDEKFVGRIDGSYIVQLIPQKCAYDQAAMRARQLNGLLLMMTGDGFDTFHQLHDGIRRDMLWLAQQFAAEVEDMVDLVRKDAKGGAV